MTETLAGGVAIETGFASPIADAERHVRAFLVTATRYLASGRELLALKRLEAVGLDTRSMSADEFDRALLKVWKNPGK
ncbi:MAG TPA: hypothetical protein VFK86_08220 [Bauldia sp.]|nr:hypothetical protein [Bauldia sp.]